MELACQGRSKRTNCANPRKWKEHGMPTLRWGGLGLRGSGINHGAKSRTAQTPRTTAARVCHGRHATRSPAASRIGRRDPKPSLIGMVRGTDALLEGHENLEGPVRAFRPAVIHGCRGALLARTEPGE